MTAIGIQLNISLVELIKSNGAKSKEKLSEFQEDIYQVKSVYINLVGVATQLQLITRLYNLRKPKGDIRVTKLLLKPTSSQPATV